MSDIIEELTTPKGAIILLIAIIALTGLFYTDLSGLTGASILGQSNIIFEDVDGNQVSYWIIPITQQEFKTEGIKTQSTSTDVSSATNYKGETVSGDISADFSLQVTSLGFKTPLVKGSDENIYVSRIYDADTVNQIWDFNEFEETSEFSSIGVKYYDTTTNSWTPALAYTAKVVIEGKTYTLNMDKSAETGVRYTVPNTNPPIYFEESGTMLGRNSATAPSLPPLSAILYGSNNNELMFINRQDKTIDEILNEDTTTYVQGVGNVKLGWNDVMNDEIISGYFVDSRHIIYEKVGNEYINEGFIKSRYDNSELNFDYNNDIVNGNWYIYLYGKYWKINSFKDFELLNINYNDYTLDESVPQLEFDSPMVIMGTWHIPVEYGNVVVREFSPTPTITRAELTGELYDTGSTILEVDVKVTGDDGVVITRLISNLDTQYIILTPETITENFEKGETKTLKFTVKGSDTTGNYEGKFTVQATGSAGETSIKEVGYTLKDYDLIETADLLFITITAVDKEGRYLSTDYPIIVSQTDTKQYGVWTGIVSAGEIAISGIPTNELFPQNKTIDVNTNNQEFTLVYAGEYYTSPIDWRAIFLILIAVFVIIAIGYGVYLISKEGKKT